MDHVDLTVGSDSEFLTAISLRMPAFANSKGLGGGFTALRPPRTNDVYCMPREKWIPDARVVECMASECRQQFTFFTRRHHCRVCGRIYCAKCSSESIHRYVDTNFTQRSDVNYVQLSAEDDHHQHLAADTETAPNGAPLVSSSSTTVRSIADNNINSNNINSNNRKTSPPSMASPLSPVTNEMRVCKECYYSYQLAICRRDVATGLPRRRCRGELKMIQRARIVDICSFLSLKDLFNVSLVSSDFYFITRDNNLWVYFNAMRWEGYNNNNGERTSKERTEEDTRSSTPTSIGSYGYRPISRDTSATGFLKGVTPSDGGEISNHCRYNYTQFLQYCTLLENARCGGLANFATNAKLLLMKSVKVAVIGHSRVGKSVMVRHFMDELYGSIRGNTRIFSPTHASHHRRTTSHTTAQLDKDGYRPTCGLVVSHKRISITGEITLPQSGVIIYDVCGDSRYEKLRALVCQSVHVIILCYNASLKKSFIEAAVQMTSIESMLGPQPVVMCGIIDQTNNNNNKEVTESDASQITPRCKASIQIYSHNAKVAFESAIQVVLDRLMIGGRQSHELISLTTNPSVFDLLIDPKVVA